MECPDCKNEVPNDSVFCNYCGHKLPPSTSLKNTEKRTSNDIAKIQRFLPKGLAEKILSQKGKIEGEKRQVTVMFCDMVGTGI
jgi:uncharacterized membrane protein YvbJ